MISNKTDQRKFNPISSYYIRDTYRTRNLNIRSEVRRIRVDEEEQEHRFRFRVDDTRRIRFTRSESLPNIDIRNERIRNTREKNIVRNTRERDIALRGIDRKTSEWNNRRFLKNRYDENNFEREVRDSRYERKISRDDINASRRTAYIRQVFVLLIKNI